MLTTTVSGPKQRLQLRRERREAVRLDAENDDVGVADRARVAGRPPACTSKSPSALIDPHAALLHRAQVRAAGEQHDVGAGAGEPRADVAADRAGARDDDSHDIVCAYALATTPR